MIEFWRGAGGYIVGSKAERKFVAGMIGPHTMSYKAVLHAPAKAKLPQRERRSQETPKMKGPMKYEKSRKGTRS